MPIEDKQNSSNIHEPLLGQAQPAFVQARQQQKIAKLEGKLEALELEHGRGFRHVVALFDSIKDLVFENDRRYELNEDEDATLDQEWLLTGYDTLMRTLPWLLKNTSDMEHDDYTCMLKMIRQGADSAQGDDTTRLKALVADWFTLPSQAQLKQFSYKTDSNNLEEGFFKGKILLQGYKAVFTSPSCAKDIESDGDGADVIQNKRHTKNSLSRIKVRFALSSVTSWSTSLKGLPVEKCNTGSTNFWIGGLGSPKVFGKSRREDLSNTVKANMSVNALARQRAQLDDVAFDSN
ncbi:hypothetical protein EV424DRAFT_1346850 [Suillus variegatus]|nr:hypothetical protein EV424DRAFT_1346850 [Suillus variegatus]